MQLLCAWLIDAATVGAINRTAKSTDYAVSLALYGLDVALSTPVFRFLKLRTAITFGTAVDTAAERTRQNR